ncbi:MAG TPA: hypothetical protein VM557_05465 [Thermoanaerobaculia bacterium]|nr:hypothetical protein [Thermoanaerobaculia bacterium]
MSTRRELTLFTIGAADSADLVGLRASFDIATVIELPAPADGRSAAPPAEIREAVTRSASDWIFLVRRGEFISQPLAAEMAGAISDPPRAWGYRLRIRPIYSGEPLLIEKGAAELRLFHRRHVRIDPRSREMQIEGAVIRLELPIDHVRFASSSEHEMWLARNAVPHSFLRRLLRFVRTAVATGALFRSPATVRYLWIEAGWDRGGVAVREED